MRLLQADQPRYGLGLSPPLIEEYAASTTGEKLVSAGPGQVIAGVSALRSTGTREG